MVVTTQHDSWDIPIGSVVYSADGRKLGKVTGADNYALRVEDGLLFPRAYLVKLSDVERYEDGELLLKRMLEDLKEQGRRQCALCALQRQICRVRVLRRRAHGSRASHLP